MKSVWALFTTLVCLAASVACSNSKNINSNTIGFAWVATSGDQKLTPFSVNLSTGAAAKNGSSVATGVQPSAMALSSDRKSIFLTNATDNTISSYTVNTDGTLKASGTPVAVPGQQPMAIAIDPGGTLVFVANRASGTVSVFTASGSSLTAATVTGAGPSCGFPNTQSFLSNPNTSSFSPNGTNNGALSSYTLNANVATLTFSSAVPTAFSSCSRISVSGVAPPDNFLNGVWTIAGTPTTTQVTINVNHANVLGSTAISGAAVEMVPNAGPAAVAVAPGGGFLYVANQLENTVSVFAYSNNSGAVTLGNPAIFLAGSNPAALAFSRCAGFTSATSACSAGDGNNLFVANSGSNNISIFTACIQVTPTCPTADGSLTQLGTSPVGAGFSPNSFIVNPVADFLYVVDSQSNEISQYKYNTATGALTSLNTPVVSTSSTPGPGGITSDGSIVLVPDTGGSTISVFKANSVTTTSGTAPTGKLSPATPPSVSLSGQPSVLLVK